MGVTSRLKDAFGRNIDSVVSRQRRGLLVATMPSREMRYLDVPFMEPGGTIEMAINGSTTGGATLPVWDGTGVGDTGADWIQTDDYGGSAESVAAMHAGTNGLDSGVTVDGDKIILDNGVATSLASYDSLTFWLNTQSRGLDSDIQLEWRDVGGRIGNKLNVSAHITWAIGSWVLVSIPIVDFALTASVQYLNFKFKNSDQQHYIDEIALSNPGGAAVGATIFRVEPRVSEEYEIHRVLLTVVAPKAGWLAGDFATIDGGLAAGVLFRRWQPFTGATVWGNNALDNLDLFGRAAVVSDVAFFDTGQLVTLEYDMRFAPIRLRETEALDFVVRDDLSSLIRLQARAQGAVDKAMPDFDGERDMGGEG